MLPGHLLRRSQVLSLLQIAPDKYLERVSVTGQFPCNLVHQAAAHSHSHTGLPGSPVSIPSEMAAPMAHAACCRHLCSPGSVLGDRSICHPNPVDLLAYCLIDLVVVYERGHPQH